MSGMATWRKFTDLLSDSLIITRETLNMKTILDKKQKPIKSMSLHIYNPSQ